MARIRSIKPEFWVDEKVVELSAWARLLFIGLWNFADDEGRMEYREKKVKMQIFPADTLDISELFGELRREGLVTVYVVDGQEYLQVNGFTEHQKIDKRSASKLPPPNNPPESPRIPTTDQGGDQGKGGDNTPLNPPQAGGKKRKPRSQIPETFTPDKSLLAWAKEKTPDVEVERETRKFVNFHRGKGNTFADHNAAWRTWMDKAQQDCTRFGNSKKNHAYGDHTLVDFDEVSNG